MPSSVMPTSIQSDGPLSPAAVSAVGLRKSYGDKVVLDGIDLRIPTGSVFALLGPNGAGKTTAVKILSTLITADGGQAQVAGHDLAVAPQAARDRRLERAGGPGCPPQDGAYVMCLVRATVIRQG